MGYTYLPTLGPLSLSLPAVNRNRLNILLQETDFDSGKLLQEVQERVDPEHSNIIALPLTHGRLQFKHQILRLGGYTKEVYLNGPTISMQAPTKDAAKGYRIDLHHCFACASLRPVKWRKMLYCAWKQTASSLDAKLKQHLSPALHESHVAN